MIFIFLLLKIFNDFQIENMWKGRVRYYYYRRWADVGPSSTTLYFWPLILMCGEDPSVSWFSKIMRFSCWIKWVNSSTPFPFSGWSPVLLYSSSSPLSASSIPPLAAQVRKLLLQVPLPEKNNKSNDARRHLKINTHNTIIHRYTNC